MNNKKFDEFDEKIENTWINYVYFHEFYTIHLYGWGSWRNGAKIVIATEPWNVISVKANYFWLYI